MDPLSDVLMMLKPRYLKAGAADVGGPMAVRIGPHDGLFCYALLTGACWLVVEEFAPLRLVAGDCVVLPSGRPFRLASDLGLEPVDAAELFEGRSNGGIVSYRGGGDCFLYAGHFTFDRHASDRLLRLLPPVIHIREPSARDMLRWCLDRIMTEVRSPGPGNDLVIEHLAHLVLVEALRLYLSNGSEGRPGWLAGLADRRIGAAMAAIHAAPAEPWTVQTLAAVAAMSRTAFATRFRATVGSSPMAYVASWRMLLAADALRDAGSRVSAVAYAVGYTSEAAFSTAFRKTMGCTPRRYGQALS